MSVVISLLTLVCVLFLPTIPKVELQRHSNVCAIFFLALRYIVFVLIIVLTTSQNY